jgi:hypothetical protein
LECASVQDVLEIGRMISKNENDFGKRLLVRIVSMRTKMIGMKNYICEGSKPYDISEAKFDYDHDNKKV